MNTDVLNFIVEPEFQDLRIDKYLSTMMPEQSRSYIQKLIKNETVFVDLKPVKSNYKVSDCLLYTSLQTCRFHTSLRTVRLRRQTWRQQIIIWRVRRQARMVWLFMAVRPERQMKLVHAWFVMWKIQQVRSILRFHWEIRARQNCIHKWIKS